jgi:hypothetical protein
MRATILPLINGIIITSYLDDGATEMTSPGCGDGLGDLPYFMPTSSPSSIKSVGRASAFPRRWRHIVCNIHAVSLDERVGYRATNWDTFYFDAPKRKRCSWALIDGVGSAFLSRRRYCAGTNVSIRQLYFAFNNCHDWNRVHVDQLFNYVVWYSGKELPLDMCF